MIPSKSAFIDERDASAVFEEFQRRRPGYLPPGKEKSAGASLGQVFSHFVEAVLQRLNQAPAKNKLAFLDLLGFRLTAASWARSLIVFKLNDSSPNTSAPKGTQVAAPPPPGSSQQIVFETEEEIGVASAKLSQIVSLWPGRDQFIDHSVAYQSGKPMVLFESLQLQPTPHVVYLAHSSMLAFAGKAHLEVYFDLAQGSSSQLDVVWEYWDGQVWREFKSFQSSCLEAAEAGHDGTRGLMSDGSVRLDTDAGQTAPTTVNGVQSYWIRGRLEQPLPPNPAQLLPLADMIRLRTLINQGLELKVSGSFAAPTAGGEPKFHFFDELGNRLRGKVTNSLFDADSGQPAELKALKTGSVYQIDVSYLDNMTGTAFMRYGLAGASADLNVVVKVEGLSPDKAMTAGKALDVSKTFYPLAQNPVLGSAFYFKQAEVFGKPGARVALYIDCPTRPPA